MGNEASQLLNKSAQGFSKGASVIQVAADTLLAGVNKLTNLFLQVLINKVKYMKIHLQIFLFVIELQDLNTMMRKEE